ncbi:amidohydrolase family protein [Tahibacter harae]|uniref:Amidohydrolase family protein n=1 Tax=Tahibacter harae TaxID=2963937 RepID=A0ABT1QVP4_9GAMM|nr:amidohydrolase family protein [Tahibacter harae]MCQ4166366.1 amidohydrolase family protein [Tahibacter harae]
MRRALRQALLGATLLAAPAVHADASATIRYAVLMEDGARAGTHTVQRRRGGITEVDYAFKDNGRGPALHERYVSAADGTLLRYTVTGTAAFGGRVDERFERHGGTAQWRSGAERGRAAAADTAQYLPVNGSPETVSRAIAQFGDRTEAQLPLLPSGELRQRRLETLDLVQADGRRRRVHLVVHTGLGLKPALFWTTAGSEPRLFAALDTGYQRLIEEGWQDQIARLARHQSAAEAVLQQESAQRFLHPLPGLARLRGVRVFDSDTATVGPRADVYVARGRITAVVAENEAVQAADWTIDGGGRVLLPGLFDMHTHVGAWDGALFLAAGVTTVRDLANDNPFLQALIDARDAGRWLGPQIVAAGLIEGDGAHASHWGRLVDGAAAARRAVDWYAVHGYRQIKLYNSFPREAVRETVAYAHARGLRVSGHVPAFLRAQDFIDAGADEIHHANQLLLNFLVSPSSDTRTLERFTLPAERAGTLDLDAAPVRSFVADLARRGVVADPTLIALSFIRQRDGEVQPGYESVVARLPPDVQRRLRSAPMPPRDAAAAARHRASFDAMIRFVGQLRRAGVPLVAGTDDLPGFSLPGELAFYVQAGMTPAETLQIATRDAARVAGVAGDRGRIAPGFAADLILVDGDPTQHIDDLHNIALVLTHNGWLSPAEVHRALSVAPGAGRELRPQAE